jgi:hypothetical protein
MSKTQCIKFIDIDSTYRNREHLTITETPLNQLGLNPQTLPEVNKGAFGDVLLYFNAVDENGKFTNETNPLILAQVLGAVKVSETLMNWITTGSSDFYERIAQLTILNNLDIMAHVFKGNIGLFISSGNDITCNNITIKNISNYSAPGKEEHVQRDHDYIGSRVSGITIVSSYGVKFNTILIDNLYSECGQVFGFYNYGNCSGIVRTNCNIHSLVTNVDYNTTGTTPRTKHVSQSIGFDKTFKHQ